jgi:YwiC-like protein
MEIITGGGTNSPGGAVHRQRRNVAAISEVTIPQKSRARALTLPREHGAWGILLVPLVAGSCVGLASGGHPLALLPFTIVTISLFCLRTPVESLLGTTPIKVQSAYERRAVVIVIVVLGLISALALASLLWHGHNLNLVAFGMIAAFAFGMQAVLKKINRNFRMAAQIAGSVGLTATAPAAYYLVTGRVDVTAIVLWVANWFFAGGQIHYVQLRIHAARCTGIRERLSRGRMFLAGQVVLATAVLIAWHRHIVPALLTLAFLPICLRGFAWFFRRPEPLAVHKLGRDELAHAIVFGMLTIAGFIL